MWNARRRTAQSGRSRRQAQESESIRSDSRSAPGTSNGSTNSKEGTGGDIWPIRSETRNSARGRLQRRGRTSKPRGYPPLPLRASGQAAAGFCPHARQIAQTLSAVTVAPITSTIRGVPSEVVLSIDDGMKAPCTIDLHNAVTISQERLGWRVARLGTRRMDEVCVALRFSFNCDS